MKAFLLYRDRDFDLQQKLPSNEAALCRDLELATLFDAMAQGDAFLCEVARKVVLLGSSEIDTILYRQDVLRDCVENAGVVREMYGIAVEAIERERKYFFGLFSRYPAGILHRSVDVLQMLVAVLKKLRRIAEEHRDTFASAGFAALFAMLRRELDDDYFAIIDAHLRQLRFRGGVLISAEPGKGNKGANYVLRRLPAREQSWKYRIFGPKPREYSFHLHPRDEAGAKALSELRDRGLNLVANALAQSTEHILSFFAMLRTELAFYVGCLNLRGRIARKGEPLSFPLPVAAALRRHTFAGLYDVCLSLSMERQVVGNEADADGKELVIITGANQGGKSTFLRSIGVAQLMMQCGMFVPARSLCANLACGIFTHYRREEDAAMESGKLDEELGRMSDIADAVGPNALVLFNESFAATNEREGAEIARQIVAALAEKRIKVFFVTHLYEFARAFYDRAPREALFLRAERRADGTRTFKLSEGEPLATSYGPDLYGKIFAEAARSR
jgi:DNA mismatch repair ATPase MutS